MPRYKLRVPQTGDFLYDDGGSVSVVADTISQAREIYRDELGEPAIYLHSYKGNCYVLYAKDIENGDGGEDSQPGDTWVSYDQDDGSALKEHQCRVWELGHPGISWQEEPVPTPVKAMDVPARTSVYHPRLGSGRTVGQPWRVSPGRVMVTVDFGWPDPQRRLACSFAVLSVQRGMRWPKDPRRLTVAGEEIVSSRDEAVLDTLKAIRVTRLRNEWEAEQFRAAQQAGDLPEHTLTAR